MNRKQFVFTLLLALVSGLMGGVLSIWFLLPPSVLAQDEPPKVIEAQEFRVIDEDGRLRARFGFGTFQDSGYGPETHLRIFDEEGKERITLVDSVAGPYFQLQEDESGPTLGISLDGGRPQLGMWHNTEGNLRVSLELLANGNPSLTFFDQDTKIRAVLGTTQLKHPDTGATDLRAPSSLVLFDEEGQVVWEAP